MREFLAQQRIHYQEKDVGQDPEAARELMKRNIMGVPTLIIGDEAVEGLNKPRILQLVDHRTELCPGCGQKMRVPVKKGRITVTCPSCKTKTEMET